MLTYHAAFWTEEGTALAKVLDFPGVIAYGKTVDEARTNLSSALVDMAETALLRGEALPVPDASANDEAAELNEPIYIVISAGTKVSVKVGAA
jgi:predicted RNase H-like HicB family nuclease